MFAEHELWVTEKGQLDASESRELYELVNERMRARQSPSDLRAYLKQGTAESEPDPELVSEMLPAQGKASGRGVLLVERQWELDQRGRDMAANGDVVFIMHPRGLPLANPQNAQNGDAMPGIRAALVGRNLPLLRVRDVLRSIDSLARMEGVKQIHAEARDVAGYWLLCAAAIDLRIASVRLMNTPWSIRAAFSAPLTRNLYQVAMPEFSLHWDTQDLIDLIKPRKLTWLNPTDWNQNVVPAKGEIYEFTKFEH